MNEVIQSLDRIHSVLEKLLQKEKKNKMYQLTEGTLVSEFEEVELLEYINSKYKTELKVNGLKNIMKLKDVKTNSKYKKIFGEDFGLVLI